MNRDDRRRQARAGGPAVRPEFTGNPLLEQQSAEFHDPYHDRASVRAGGRMILNLSQVFENVETSLERIELDPEAPFAIGDVLPPDEIMTVFSTGLAGHALLDHTATVATRILLDRGYPEEFVRAPIPADYDLCRLTPLTLRAGAQPLAKEILNRRLRGDDIPIGELVGAEVSAPDQADAWMAIVVMYAHKLRAIRTATGASVVSDVSAPRPDRPHVATSRPMSDDGTEGAGSGRWPSEAMDLLGVAGTRDLEARIAPHGECGACHRPLEEPWNFTVIDVGSVSGVRQQPSGEGTHLLALPTHPSCAPATWVSGRGARPKVSPDATWTAMAIATELRRIAAKEAEASRWWRRPKAAQQEEERRPVAVLLVNPSIDVIDIEVGDDGAVRDRALAAFRAQGFTDLSDWGSGQPQVRGVSVTKNTADEIYVTHVGGEWSCDSAPAIQALVEAQGGVQVFVAVKPLTGEVEAAGSLKPLMRASEEGGLVVSCWAPLAR